MTVVAVKSAARLAIKWRLKVIISREKSHCDNDSIQSLADRLGNAHKIK